jgi:hypothetical protein
LFRLSMGDWAGERLGRTDTIVARHILAGGDQQSQARVERAGQSLWTLLGCRQKPPALFVWRVPRRSSIARINTIGMQDLLVNGCFQTGPAVGLLAPWEKSTSSFDPRQMRLPASLIVGVVGLLLLSGDRQVVQLAAAFCLA